MSWGDYAPLMHDAVVDRLGDLLTATTAAGEDFSFRASWEYEDYIEDDGRFVRLFAREENVARRLTAGARVTVEGEEYAFVVGSVIRRDGGVEFQAERKG